MKRFRLTRPSRIRLKEIAKHTVETFGLEQAKRYEQQLIEAVEKLCRSPFPLGRSCSLLQEDKLLTSNILYIREGMHYILFVDAEDRITVHDFVHVSRNLPAIISSLEAELLK